MIQKQQTFALTVILRVEELSACSVVKQRLGLRTLLGWGHG